MMEDAVLEFKGHYKFLSNFYPAKIRHEGMEYPSAEHVYQASKSDDHAVRARIAQCSTAAKAKAAGRKVKMYSGFEANRVDVMKKIVRKKFVQNEYLLVLLLDTDDCFLAEGNWWGDTFWGIHEGHGRNMLGQILMELREELKDWKFKL